MALAYLYIIGRAQTTGDTIPSVRLGEVVVTERAVPAMVGTPVDLTMTPVRSAQEVLRTVPGLFIAQHAGGGKAEQLFLRGFDLDHGTDIAITVDGMPVNLTTHAHGQGYADLHFLQPEAVEEIRFGKGPHSLERGNLATAGFVDFRTKDRMTNEATLELGGQGTERLRTSFSFLDDERQSLYVSASLLHTDGYFDAPQNFYRLNLMGKYTRWTDEARTSISLSHFDSDWDASGQIPLRAVRDGRISRFGAIDDTEGGRTERTNLNLLHSRFLGGGGRLNSAVWLSHSRFSLYSNFTFYLNDAENGDQIHQTENRLAAGMNTDYTKPFTLGQADGTLLGGFGFRYDRTNNLGLHHTVKRSRIGTFSLGRADESNLYGYLGMRLVWGKWTLTPGVRLDALTFAYEDRLTDSPTRLGARKTIVSPKLGLSYRPDPRTRLFVKLGKGFHSNDARVVTMETELKTLPSAYGLDIGAEWKPLPSLSLSGTAWYLGMEQEMVYVGDEAVVEAGGRTRRWGVDVGVGWDALPDVRLQADYTFSHARSVDAPAGEDRVPLAPTHTLTASVGFRRGGWTANVRSRFLADRPATEDGSLTAQGYFVTDVNASYTLRRLTVGVLVENVFNTRWREAQFATTTRLPDEENPVTEIHFTPGTPLYARCFVTLRF